MGIGYSLVRVVCLDAGQALTRADVVSLPTTSTPPCPQPPLQASDLGAIGAGFSPSHSLSDGLGTSPGTLEAHEKHFALFLPYIPETGPNLALKSREVPIVHCDSLVAEVWDRLLNTPSPCLGSLSLRDCIPVWVAQVTLSHTLTAPRGLVV